MRVALVASAEGGGEPLVPSPPTSTSLLLLNGPSRPAPRAFGPRRRGVWSDAGGRARAGVRAPTRRSSLPSPGCPVREPSAGDSAATAGGWAGGGVGRSRVAPFRVGLNGRVVRHPHHDGVQDDHDQDRHVEVLVDHEAHHRFSEAILRAEAEQRLVRKLSSPGRSRQQGGGPREETTRRRGARGSARARGRRGRDVVSADRRVCVAVPGRRRAESERSADDGATARDHGTGKGVPLSFRRNGAAPFAHGRRSRGDADRAGRHPSAARGALLRRSGRRGKGCVHTRSPSRGRRESGRASETRGEPGVASGGGDRWGDARPSRRRVLCGRSPRRGSSRLPPPTSSPAHRRQEGSSRAGRARGTTRTHSGAVAPCSLCPAR